uniref:C2H2-type domain-containing protein n=2 Tax=Lygus hesperus TaxID=30085 RepID=A0A0K8SB90_LYGHE
MSDIDEDVQREVMEEVESTVDVMKDYLEKDSISSSDNDDIFGDCNSDSNEGVANPSRKKCVWATHIKIIDDDPPIYYQCTICKTFFSHSNTARSHEFCGSGEKPFKCKLCNKRFVKKCDRDNHYRTHTGERPFACSFCNKTFQLKHKLSRHIRSHTGIKGDFECLKCRRSFICKEALRKHEVSKHTSEATKCKLCKKVFDNNEERSKHKCSRKNRKKEQVCEICGKRFSRNWNLTVHQRIHKGQRPYECSTCQKTFRLRQHLERHSAKHQPDADFECTLCNQTFGRKDNMVRHLKLTHPDRPLGEDLNEIMKRAGKTKNEKMKKSIVALQSEIETSAVPTILPVDNLPNIRFAKMPSGHSRNKSNEKSRTVISATKDLGSVPTPGPRVNTISSNPVNNGELGIMPNSTVYASKTVKSVVMTTVVQAGGNQIVRRTTTRVMQQSSVLCPTATTLMDRSDPQGTQPSCIVPVTRDNQSPCLQTTDQTHEMTDQPQNNIKDVSKFPTRYLPVSVLCFKSSSELRKAVPKNIASNSPSNA